MNLEALNKPNPSPYTCAAATAWPFLPGCCSQASLCLVAAVEARPCIAARAGRRPAQVLGVAPAARGRDGSLSARAGCRQGAPLPLCVCHHTGVLQVQVCASSCDNGVTP